MKKQAGSPIGTPFTASSPKPSQAQRPYSKATAPRGHTESPYAPQAPVSASPPAAVAAAGSEHPAAAAAEGLHAVAAAAGAGRRVAVVEAQEAAPASPSTRT